MTELLTRGAPTRGARPAPTTLRDRLRRDAATALGTAGELLLGARCLGCGAPTVGLCPGCREAVVRRDPLPVLPQPCPDDFPLTVAASSYDPILRQLITAHKDRQAWLLTGFLGDRLAVAVRAVLDELAGLSDPADPVGRASADRIVLVPVPSAAAAVRRRGRDATLAIARRAARRLGAELGLEVRAVSGLRPTRRMADQSGLGADQRAANVRDGFRVGRRAPLLTGATVIVVDDLVTTGSSLLEASRALHRAGLPVAGAASAAATELRRPRHPSGRVG